MTLVEGIARRVVVGQWVIRRLLIHGNDDGCVFQRCFLLCFRELCRKQKFFLLLSKNRIFWLWSFVGRRNKISMHRRLFASSRSVVVERSSKAARRVVSARGSGASLPFEERHAHMLMRCHYHSTVVGAPTTVLRNAISQHAHVVLRAKFYLHTTTSNQQLESRNFLWRRSFSHNHNKINQQEEATTTHTHNNHNMSCSHQPQQQQASNSKMPTWYKPTGAASGIKIFNSLTHEKDEFVPIDPHGRHITWYTCGPTVYDMSHMGHARYVSFMITKKANKNFHFSCCCCCLWKYSRSSYVCMLCEKDPMSVSIF